jgi:mycolipenoyl-CoA---2-(long-chain-fatty acyl)-trehalose mycolipenoyltransferase / long-chain-acyl-CoA---trehalose acyltransferase
MSVDRLLTDGMSAGVIFLEIHMTYAALLAGGTPVPLADPANYDDYSIGPPKHSRFDPGVPTGTHLNRIC